MRTSEILASLCPDCGHKFELATSIASGQPRPRENDYTICVGCVAVLRFNADLSTRRATSLELDELDLESYARIAEIRNFIQRNWPRRQS